MSIESEGYVPQEAHDLRSAAKVRAELLEQIEALEKELDNPALTPPDIRAKEEELKFFRQQYAETNPNKQ